VKGGLSVKSHNRARLMLALAMTVFGTIPLFVRHIPVTSAELALYRAVLASLFLGIGLPVTGKLSGKIPEKGTGKKALLLLFLSGAAMGINWILLFQSYRYTTVTVSTLSYYFAPVIVTVVSPVLFRERMTSRQIFCSVMAALGLVLVVLSDSGDGGASSHITGILYGLGAAVFYAAVVILNKFIRSTDGIRRTFFQFISAVIVLVPYVAVTEGLRIPVLDGTGLVCLLVVGLVHTGLTYCLYFSAVKEMSGQEASILSYLDPLTAVVLSAAVLGEKMTLPGIAGGLMILGFTFWNELGGAGKRERPWRSVIKTALYWIWHLSWGIIQTTAGFILFVICSAKGGKHRIYRGAVVTSWKKPESASVGPFLFLSDSLAGGYYERVLAHEFGHSVQSLILGPLYLPAVGLPSYLWCNLRYFRFLRQRTGRSYYSVYPENWADRLGGVKGE